MKIKYSLVNHKKRIKSMAPSLFDAILLVMGLAMLCLSFEFDWQYFGGFNGAVLIYVFIECFIWFVDVIVFLIICKVKHIDPKSVNIDEEKKA